jgi:hypothetical protein
VTGSVPHIRYRIDVNTQAHHPATQLHLNEIGLCEVALGAPIAFDPYTVCKGTGAFIVIDRLSNVTIGAGMITGPVGGETELKPVTAMDRQNRLGQRPARIWLTGENRQLLMRKLERQLFDRGFLSAPLEAEILGEQVSAVLETLTEAGIIALISAPLESAPAIPHDGDLVLPEDRYDIHEVTLRVQADRGEPLDYQI